MIFTKKSIEFLIPGSTYIDCCIYQSSRSSHYIEKNTFINCTFRTDFFAAGIECSSFENCTFNGNLKIESDPNSCETPFGLYGKEEKETPLKDITSFVALSFPLEKNDHYKSQYVDYMDLPPRLSLMKSLRTLDVSYCEVIDTGLFPISFLDNLEELWLDHMGHVSFIPRDITSRKKLKFLSMAHNSISEIPDHFSDLQNLKFCVLPENDLPYEQRKKAISLLPNCKFLF